MTVTTSEATSYHELTALLEQVDTDPHTIARVTDAQLVRLQQRWTTALFAHLDEMLERGGVEPLDEAVAEVWRELAAQRPALRAVLDAGEARSTALARAERTELRMLAVTAGLAGLDDREAVAVVLGAALRDRIRAGVAHAPARAA
jgi:hypothetical protein